MRKMFSENQIKSIVNQGIESGEISGGTKLYKHIAWDSDELNCLIIICNKNEQFNLSNAISLDNSEQGIISITYYDDNAGAYTDCGAATWTENTLSITTTDGEQSITAEQSAESYSIQAL